MKTVPADPGLIWRTRCRFTDKMRVGGVAEQSAKNNEYVLTSFDALLATGWSISSISIRNQLFSHHTSQEIYLQECIYLVKTLPGLCFHCTSKFQDLVVHLLLTKTQTCRGKNKIKSRLRAFSTNQRSSAHRQEVSNRYFL